MIKGLPLYSPYAEKVCCIAEYKMSATSGNIIRTSSYVIRKSCLPEKRRRLTKSVRRNDGDRLFASAILLPQTLTSSIVQVLGCFCFQVEASSPLKSQSETSIPNIITIARLFKYIENFTTKKGKFSDKKYLIFFIFLLKT